MKVIGSNSTIQIHLKRVLRASVICFFGFDASQTLLADDLQDEEIVEVFLFPYTHKSYKTMIEGFDIFNFDSWKDMDLERHTLEVLIFNVAPIIGGCECQIDLKEYAVQTPHARSIEQVRAGKEVSHPVAVFSGDSRIQDDFYLSEPILDSDDFFVGLYTHSGRSEILSLSSEEEIQSLRFVAGRSWEIDNKVLDNLGVQRIAADNWKAVIYMLMDGRADVVMQPFFATDDLSFAEIDATEKFLPIPNVKMRFEQDRIFAVSKNHPQGADFLKHLNAGLKIMKEDNDLLKRAHEWAGVINEQTSDYTILFDKR